MKQKSLIATIFMVAILFIPGVQDMFGQQASLWISTIYTGLVAFWKKFYDSNNGAWAFTGWKTTTLLVNVGMFIIALVATISTYLGTKGVMIPSPVAMGLVKLTTVINSMILVINSGVLGGMAGLNAGKTEGN